MTMTTGNFAKFLWPGINSVYGRKYNDYNPEYTDLVDTESSSKAWEEDVGISSFGLASVKTEGGSIEYDDEHQAYLTRYNHIVYAKGFIVTRELVEDDQYAVVGGRRAKALARSMRHTKETVVTNVYNRGFNSSYTGGDGKELLATDHPNWAGGTWANEPSTAADMSEASLEQACIDISKWTDDRGLKIRVMPRALIIPVDLQFEAERILTSTQRVSTADNDTNALRQMGKFPGGVKVNHWLTDTDAWFIRTDVQEGLKLFQRRAMNFAPDNDFDTENAKYKASERYSVGWTDPRALYGSPGA